MFTVFLAYEHADKQTGILDIICYRKYCCVIPFKIGFLKINFFFQFKWNLLVLGKMNSQY